MCDKFSLNLEEASAILYASTETTSAFAMSGKLPGAKIGKAWVFLRTDVEAFLADMIEYQTQGRLDTQQLPQSGRITRVR